MIIAMMGKTFDKFWEAAREQAATQFAKTVQDWEDQTEMPAPFLLLALPSSLFDSLRAMYACSRNCINGTLAYTMRQSTHKQLHDELDLLPCLSPRMQQKVYHVRRVELANLKEKVTEELLEKFGQYDSTAELIDQAVKFLASKIDTQRAVPRSNLGQHLEGSSSTFDDTCA
uniref:Uncharacterized protein n=1 Tax=Haptolina ericina TaxID=156174 RepID=A0A6T9ISK0_9EUKA|mmetsp:Transcript_46839/g.105612  ORF Transcript_46839/g.105612 Transcript_46839/m.105612 type:complete len:172 (-) Transcript_46839:440-955(-)